MRVRTVSAGCIAPHTTTPDTPDDARYIQKLSLLKMPYSVRSDLE
jgi:hypothetical protein